MYSHFYCELSSCFNFNRGPEELDFMTELQMRSVKLEKNEDWKLLAIFFGRSKCLDTCRSMHIRYFPVVVLLFLQINIFQEFCILLLFIWGLNQYSVNFQGLNKLMCAFGKHIWQVSVKRTKNTLPLKRSVRWTKFDFKTDYMLPTLHSQHDSKFFAL
jgi:hypothetical protein